MARYTTEEGRMKYRERKRKENMLYYGQTAYKYPKRAWKEEEIEMIMAHTLSDREISEKIKRSMKSIQEKRRRIRREEEAKAALAE
ncbi:MAG: hypothetical protein LUG52_04865 [Clostridia bacterium]|nr:hypothetical protein [Clostridia bacterium]